MIDKEGVKCLFIEEIIEIIEYLKKLTILVSDGIY